MSQEKEDPANLIIQVFWAVTGLFALMILGGAAAAIFSGMQPDHQLTPLDKQLDSPSSVSPVPSPKS